MGSAPHEESGLSPEDIRIGATAFRDLLLSGERYRRSFAEYFALGQAEAVAMSHFAAEERLSPSQLADLMGVTPGAVTALVDRLEAAGHVVRVPHPTDGRQSVIKTTSGGGEIVKYAQANLISALERLSDVELRRLSVLLGELLPALESESLLLARLAR